MSNFFKHLKTVNLHRKIVKQLCFKLGLYRQGLFHDLSKYSPTEFFVGVKYYNGDYSPNNAERRDNGHSLAWLHHKGRNPHHTEYWIDYSADGGQKKMSGVKMPAKYLAELFCDRVSACMVYQREKYSDASAYEYFIRTKEYCIASLETLDLIEKMLLTLKKHGMDKTIEYIKRDILKKI
ncbi:MAG: DUF5662 family protein [Eubacterium sp.]|nr:DUF5662 family protein [Eubacterium sp.]